MGLITSKEFIILPPLLSLIFTSLWIVGLTNALNWIDGIDGLAASLTSLALVGNLYLFFLNDNLSFALLMIVVLSSSLVFLKFNINKASIIMGDGGSYFLGYLFATTALIASTNNNNNTFIITPILFFVIPIFDMVIVNVKVLNSQSPFFGDRKHIHIQASKNLMLIK